jgi:hypothetical protein
LFLMPSPALAGEGGASAPDEGPFALPRDAGEGQGGGAYGIGTRPSVLARNSPI